MSIECDMHNREHPADVMVSRFANGETFAACDAAFIEFCIGIAGMASQAEADATDADALRRLGEPVGEQEFPTSVATSSAAEAEAEPRSALASEPGATGSDDDSDDDAGTAPTAALAGRGRSGKRR
jgi:hypothetical protein